MNWFKNKDKRISELEDKNNTLENLYSAVNIMNEELKNKLDKLEKENKQLREWFNGILEKYGDRQCVDSLIPYLVKHERDIARMERKEIKYVPPIEITTTIDIMDEIEESFNR